MHLRYYLICGSALGAVKYGGFIPWDDDVDVGMPRADYDIFCRLAPDKLPDDIFLQTYQSERCFPSIYAKMRNSNTTCIEETASKLPINHGVFIDIFPLDGYPQKHLEQYCLEFKKHLYIRLLGTVYSRNSWWKEKIMKCIRELVTKSYAGKLADAYTKMISSYPYDGSEIIANHGNWQGKLDYSPKTVFGNGVDAEFENITVKIPEQYEAYLTKKYGDFWKDPPAERQMSHHVFTQIDVTHSYLEYTGE